MRTEIIYVESCSKCPFYMFSAGTALGRGCTQDSKIVTSYAETVPKQCPLRSKELQITLKQGV